MRSDQDHIFMLQILNFYTNYLMSFIKQKVPSIDPDQLKVFENLNLQVDLSLFDMSCIRRKVGLWHVSTVKTRISLHILTV